ncbi:MAG: hypothetical protein U0414_26360 [Polyangiaceae bacterium]
MSKRSWVLRLTLTVASVAAIAIGCTGGPTPPKAPQKTEGACDATALSICVKAIDDALDAHEDPAAAVRAYAGARAKSGDEALSKLLDAMDGSTAKAFAIGVGGARVDAKQVTVLSVDGSLADTPLASARLLLALGKTAGASLVVARLADGTALRAYPADALAPLGAGLPAISIGGDTTEVDAEAELEANLTKAAAAGAAFDYVALADAIDAIDAYSAAHPGYAAASLRARIFSAFVSLSEIRIGSGPPPERPGPPPEPNDLETTYYDLLRVRVDPTEGEWSRRSARILSAFPADRRDAITSVFATNPPCGYRLPPPIERVEDLVFAGLVSRALLPTMARDAMERVPLETWYPAYTKFVKTVSATDTTYLFAARLVMERGASAGIVPSGSEAHRIVANLATKHANALAKLAGARPGRVGLAQMPFLIAPGNMLDPDLRKATLDLAQAIAKGGLGQAKDAGDTLLALFTSVLTGFDLPGDLRAAHLGALQSVFAAKLKGEFATETGWGVALLFGIDGAYRLVFDQAPNVGQTAAEITRALEGDPAIAQPAAAHLIGAVARYVTLGLRGELGPAQPKPNTMRPERATAKAALEKAIAELGAASTAAGDETFVRDVGELCDASLTTLANTLAEKLQTTPTAPTDAGCPNDTTPLGPRTKNALPPLRDIRNKVTANPAWKSPGSPRARRLKLVVLAISDVIDAIDDNGEHAHAFAISGDDAKAILHAALDEWIGEPGLANAIAGAYSLLRGYGELGRGYFATATPTKGAPSSSSAAFDIRTLLGGLGAFLKGGEGAGIEGAVLLSMLLPSGPDAKSEDLIGALAKVARSLYGQKKTDEGDMILLGSLVVSAARGAPPAAEAAELAETQGGSVAWVMQLWRAVANVRDGAQADTTAFKKDLSAAIGAKCAIGSVDEVSQVLTAIQDFRAGKRAEARKSLDAVLTALMHKGFALPRYRYVFKQETRSRALSLSVEVGLAQGMVGSANAFAIGAGAKTDGEPVLSLDKFVSAPDSKESLDEAAKYYVHTLAILAVFDFLDGDLGAADLDAARVVSLLHAPSWLSRSGVTDDPSRWARDSAGILMVLGELAAKKDRPFLAGDLFALVKQALDASDDEETLAGLLEPPPFGLAGVADAAPVIAEAKKTLPLLAAHLPCMKGKKASTVAPTCSEYAHAIALRVADALPSMPKLAQKKECPDTAKIDAFLEAADKRVYDPDRYLDAVDVLVASQRPYDASVMLTRFRRDDHCSQGVIDRLTALVATLKAVPSLRADLETVLVNCSTGAAPADLAQALSALDDDLVLVGDPTRSVNLVLFSAGASVKVGSWEPLEAIALKPGFLDRWEARAPESLFAGLVLDHAATILHGDAVRLDATAPSFDLICGGVPPPERAPICKLLEGLRKAGKPDDALKKAAADAIVALIQPSP